MRPTPRIEILLLLVAAFCVGASSQTNPFTLSQTYCTGTNSDPCVLTHHNNNNRDGVNPNETVFKAFTLSYSNHPTPQWLASTDGLIYAQPLYIHQLSVGNGLTKNVVYAFTENNSVYAFNADTGTVLKQVSLNSPIPNYAETAVPNADIPYPGCGTIEPEIGITGTPVIDVSVTPPVIYLVTKHKDTPTDRNNSSTIYRQKLHGLYADTLQEIPGSPLVLDSTFATNHAPDFDPLANNQRAGLTLVTAPSNTANIWVTWGSHCDNPPYSGLAIEFDYTYGTPGFGNAYEVAYDSHGCMGSTPCQTGLWMGGGAPAADSNGNVYVETGNDKAYTAKTGTSSGQYSDSILKLQATGIADWYSPPDYLTLNIGGKVACTNPNPPSCPTNCTLTGQYCQITLSTDDWDLGSAGVVLLSPTFSLSNPELVAGGKQGMIYVAFSGSLGGVDSHSSAPDKYACTVGSSPGSGTIAQCFQGTFMNVPPSGNGSWGAPAFLAGGSGTNQQNWLYVAGIKDTLNAYQMASTGLFSTTPISGAHMFPYPGASPSVTWNSSSASNINDAIVWALDNGGYGVSRSQGGHAATAAVLYAYQAVPSGSLTTLWDTHLYNTGTPGSPGAVKFVVPTIVDGKIFLGGGAQGYWPGETNCPTFPTACGGIAMYK